MSTQVVSEDFPITSGHGVMSTQVVSEDFPIPSGHGLLDEPLGLDQLHFWDRDHGSLDRLLVHVTASFDPLVVLLVGLTTKVGPTLIPKVAPPEPVKKEALNASPSL